MKEKRFGAIKAHMVPISLRELAEGSQGRAWT